MQRALAYGRMSSGYVAADIPSYQLAQRLTDNDNVGDLSKSVVHKNNTNISIPDIAPDTATDTSNEQLMVDYSQGQTEAFAMLYQRNKAGLYRYFLRQSNNSATAEELSQDVWTKLIQSAHRYKPTAKFSTFLYQIAHNRFIDYIRRQKIRPIDSSQNSTESTDIVDNNKTQPDEQLQQNRLETLLKQLLYDLPQQQREAFLLKEEGGLSLSEIAYVTGCNNETVKSRLRYANRKLRSGLGDLI